MILYEEYLNFWDVAELKDKHFCRFDNIIFTEPLVMSNMFISQFYNCRFQALNIEKEANDISFINCSFFSYVSIKNATALNIIGGHLEGVGGIGELPAMTIVDSNLVNINGMYFENNEYGDILVDTGYGSSINIRGSYFNSSSHTRKSIEAIGMSRPNIENNMFVGKQAYNLIDIRCRTKNNSFDSLLKKVINL